MRTNLTPLERWEISYITTKILSESRSAHQAAARILHLLGTRLEAAYSDFWVLDGFEPSIRCAATWPDSESASPFDAISRSRKFGIGEGIPGKVWETRDVVWIPNVQTAANFPRASVAKAVGLKTGIGFPALQAKVMLAVIEVFSEGEHEPDHGLMEFFRALGAQIGLFLEHFNMTASLAGAEAQFQLIADASRDAVVTIDEESTILFANTAIDDLLGYKPEELIGQSLTIIMPERFHDLHRRGMSNYRATGEKRLDWNDIALPGLHKNGGEVPLRFTFGEFLRGGKRVFTGFIRKA